jgi:hypothetical protein
MKHKRKVAFFLTFIALCVLHGRNILWTKEIFTKPISAETIRNKYNETRGRVKLNLIQQTGNIRPIVIPLENCSHPAFQSEMSKVVFVFCFVLGVFFFILFRYR